MSNDIVECLVEEVTAEIVTREPNFTLNNSNSFPEKLAAFFDEPVPTFLYDPSFEDELRKFLAKQKELDALRHEFVKRMYSPFIVSWNNLDLNKDKSCNYRICIVYLNTSQCFSVELLLYRHTYRVIRSDDFRSILIRLSIPHAEWINKINDHFYIDLIEFFIHNKIQYNLEYAGSDTYRLTLYNS